MPGKRIPDLPAIAGASTANDDNLVIYDTDASTTKRILRSQLAAGLVGDLPYTPSGGISATTVPTAIAELDSEAAKSATLAAQGGAALIGNTPAGTIAATTVQAALNELDTEKTTLANVLARLDDNDGSSLVGYLPAGSGAVTRTAQSKMRDVVSVLDFGADPTGATDSTTEIQAAIDAISENSTLIFPAGVYLVSSNLTKTGVDRFTISGYGAKVFENGASLTGVFTLTDCEHVVFEGLSFEATEDNTYFQANNPTQERSFLYMNNCDYATVKDISGKNKRRLATFLNCDFANVDGYFHQGFFGAISLPLIANAKETPAVTNQGCNNSTWSNGIARECGAVYQQQLSARNVTIKGMVGKDMWDAAVYVSSGINVTVTGCSIKDGMTDGIKGRTVYNGGNIAIIGNTVENVGLGNGSGIVLTGAGVTVDSFGANGKGLIATGNTIIGCQSGIQTRQADGFYPRDINISNNTVLDCYGTGDVGAIEIRTAIGGVVCNGNIVRTAAMDSGIVLTPDAGTNITDVVCSGNLISDINGNASNTRGGIRATGVNNGTFTNNVFVDIACGIGIRIRRGANGVISNNSYFGGQVALTTPTSGTTTGFYVYGNTGATLVCDGSVNPLGVNAAAVTGYPATSTTPLARGLNTYSGGNAFISVATSSSADWKQTT
jgi:hypothetical protein